MGGPPLPRAQWVDDTTHRGPWWDQDSIDDSPVCNPPSYLTIYFLYSIIYRFYYECLYSRCVCVCVKCHSFLEYKVRPNQLHTHFNWLNYCSGVFGPMLPKLTEFDLSTGYRLHKFSFWLNIPHCFLSKYPMRSAWSHSCPMWHARLGLVTLLISCACFMVNALEFETVMILLKHLADTCVKADKQKQKNKLIWLHIILYNAFIHFYI